MSEAVAKRYAEALFQITQEQSSTDQVEQQLQIIAEVFNSNQELIQFLKHPRVDEEKKKLFLKDTFKDFSAVVTNLLQLLVDRHRDDLVLMIIKHYLHLSNDAKGIAEATVYSVRSLENDEKQQLSAVFAKRLNKNALNIENIVDSSLLGGVKIKIGNTIYDGSIKGKLERFERNIVSANKG
ncbi:F0F1 ATP synthase subunit delta [Radiobacillus sp. PE A8.2]|uniref:F0F1 ATP synthase subunit delta n=1 Tax=Radiobacillus sp. PE A8.2 TaxID=3380349 RepID=UPI00388FCE9B